MTARAIVDKAGNPYASRAVRADTFLCDEGGSHKMRKTIGDELCVKCGQTREEIEHG